MGKIKVLSQQLIDQIAAGEVVERPASVVKELVENALDARATFVEIEISRGGKEKILVRDNGVGMFPEDARLAFKRYATSKIGSAEDLAAIKTFGFRGEALSSIASVAKVDLKTKTEGAVQGTEVVLEGGVEKAIKPCAHPQGTTLVVSDLFYNLVVRQKFLKSESTEFNHIKSWVLAQALACPRVGFSLYHNQKEILNFPENQAWEQRLEVALELNMDDLAPVSLETDYVKVSGVVGLPQVARERRVNQYLFVNRRFLQNRTVWAAVREAYKGLLPASLHPQYILDLKVREDLLDVNIHPRKEEVKFITASVVFDAVVNAIRSALSRCLEKDAGEFSYKAPTVSSSGIQAAGASMPTVQVSRTSREQLELARPREFIREVLDFGVEEKYGPNLFQIGQLYIVSLEEDGLVIIDQHAADERLLLEEFVQRFKERQVEGQSQELLFPKKLKLHPEEKGVFKRQAEILEKIGFRFGINGEVTVEAVPVVIKDRDIEKVLLGFIDDFSSLAEAFDSDRLEGSGRELGVDRETLKSLTYLACRSAVKQGEVLTLSQMRTLIDKLGSLKERGLVCPHGRPTQIKLKLKDLHKMFKRK